MLLGKNNKMEGSRKALTDLAAAPKLPFEILKVFWSIFNKSYTVHQLWKAIT